MAEFKYKAINPKGEIMEGSHRANSKEEIYNIIASNGFSPLRVEEVVGSKEIVLRRKKINTKDLSIFCRQLATMLEAGVSLTYSMGVLAEQIPNKKLREILPKVNEDIRKGEELSVAMGKYENDFPKLLISMIEVGENSGTLDSIMNRMAIYYENQTKMNGKIKNAMIYPAVLSVVTVAIVTFILVYLMPMFVDMFESSEYELPVLTRGLLAFSTFIKDYLIVIVIGIFAVVMLCKRYYTKTEVGQYKKSVFKLKHSLFKDLARKTIVSRFSRGIATVLGAGLSMNKSLDVVSGVLDNKYAEERLEAVKEKVLVGEALSEALRVESIFPPMLSSMIKIGEESGDIDGILSKTADFYDEELDRAISNFTATLEPVMIIIMGVIVGFLIISILTPMFSMYNTMF